MALDQVIVDEQVFEAPAELRYRIRELLDDPPTSGRWFGQPSLVLGQSPFTTTRPYDGAAIGTVEGILRRMGFDATAVRLVSSPPRDPVPLACRVWTKSDGAYRAKDPDSLAEIWLKDHSAKIPRLLNLAVGTDFPELVDFPPNIGDFAAIGSLSGTANTQR